ncbi:type I restriction enzyme endonuclease domain-containing protein, partial [Staphylococcus epidermidis]|uniref:type I restriction enzyme endonuclease domain-containing protein n=1 Tax=Staphylococcus epidermidis TaxID=1282 RepID=UPI0011A2BC41
MGDKEVGGIGDEVSKRVKEKMGVDWCKGDSGKGKMGVAVRGLVKKYGYAGDLEKMGVEQVVEEAEVMGNN